MKNTIFFLLICLTVPVSAYVYERATLQPAPLFDVRTNGNNITIACRDAAAKQAVIDALAKRGSFSGTDAAGLPQTKEDFVADELTQFFAEIIAQQRTTDAVTTAASNVDKTDLPKRKDRRGESQGARRPNN